MAQDAQAERATLRVGQNDLLELVYEGQIRSVVIRKPGAIRGIRLIFMPSLEAFLEGLSKQGVAT